MTNKELFELLISNLSNDKGKMSKRHQMELRRLLSVYDKDINLIFKRSK